MHQRVWSYGARISIGCGCATIRDPSVAPFVPRNFARITRMKGKRSMRKEKDKMKVKSITSNQGCILHSPPSIVLPSLSFSVCLVSLVWLDSTAHRSFLCCRPTHTDTHRQTNKTNQTTPNTSNRTHHRIGTESSAFLFSL